MRNLSVITNFMLIMAVCVACANESAQQSSLPQIKLHCETFCDSVNNIKLTLMLPIDNKIPNDEVTQLISTAYNSSEKSQSPLDIALKNHRNCHSSLEVLHMTPKIISTKTTTTSWVDGGDTLNVVSYMSYLRGTESKLNLNDIISNATEIDKLIKLLNNPSLTSNGFLPPDVDIIILGDSVAFHYDKHKQQPLKVTLPTDDMIDEFDKFKTLYNE